jgi:alpha-tubulin suppressor-like RCC1 family protein
MSLVIYSAGDSANGQLFHPGDALALSSLDANGVAAIDSTQNAVFVLYENGNLKLHKTGSETDLQSTVGSASAVKCVEDKAFILTRSGTVFMSKDSLKGIPFPETPVKMMSATKDALWAISEQDSLMAMTQGIYSFPKVVTGVGGRAKSLASLQIGEEFLGAVVTDDNQWRIYYISPQYFRVLPKSPTDPEKFEAFYGRDGNLLGITPERDAYTLGFNNHGQLGVGGNANAFCFQKVELGENVKVVSGTYGHEFLLLFTDAGTVFSCGLNDHKQLMIDSPDDENTPKAIDFNGEVRAAYAGHAQAYLLSTPERARAESRVPAS